MRPVTTGPMRPPLTMLAYDALWSDLYPRQPKPLVLDAPAFGVTDQERATMHRRGWQELTGKGYGWPKSVATDIRQALDILHNPLDELSMRSADVRAMAARRFTAGTLGVIQADHLRLHQLDGAFLAEALLGLLPEHRAASLDWQHSVQEGTLADAGARLRTPDGQPQSYQAISDALRESGTPAEIGDLIATLTTEPFIRRAEFSGAVWTQNGRQRSTRSVVVHDTKAGRYLITRTAGTVQVTGANEARIIQELRRMVGQIVVTR